MTMDYHDLTSVYTQALESDTEPNLVVTSLKHYNWVIHRYAPGTDWSNESPPKSDFWETDNFVSWGRALYQEARRPKNSTLRQFLGTTRWERRGR